MQKLLSKIPRFYSFQTSFRRHNNSVEEKISHYWILLKLYMKSAAFPLDWQEPVDIPVKYRNHTFTHRNLIKGAVRMSPAEGNLLPDVLTRQLCEEYIQLDHIGREKFLNVLTTQFGADNDDLITAVDFYKNEMVRSDKNEKRLIYAKSQMRNALTPMYENLFDTIIKQKHGMKWILDLRKDLLEIVNDSSKTNPNLVELNNNMKTLLSSWFSMGFLQLHRLSWETPAFILEKIMALERVHMIHGWSDLKRRVGLSRRLFCFVHPSMPDEPLVFVQVCLTDRISDNIQGILGVDGTLQDEMNANTAIFYSITSTQDGLNGVELGNFLIKRVVSQLQMENPKIKTFSTLSPIPGFMKWLQTKLHYKTLNPTQIGFLMPEEKRLLLNMDSNQTDPYLILKSIIEKPTVNDEIRGIMMRLCANYLYNEKKRGKAYDPVANFHIKNGSLMYRLNWKADLSPNGMKLSYSMMVNYKYEWDSIERNNEQYLLDGKISVGEEFLKFLN